MKKNTILIFGLLISLLTACQKEIPLEYKEYQSLETAKETIKTIPTLKVEDKLGVVVKTGVTSFSSLNDVSHAFDVKNYSMLSNNSDPTQVIEQKLLVVPVYFTDSSVNNNQELQAKKKTLIENAFFGDPSVTSYQSVASYYNLSSYGHLRLKGEVLDWSKIDYTGQQAASMAKSKPEDFTDNVVYNIVNALSEEKINEYISNESEVIDSVFIVYDYPYAREHADNTLLWAFTSHYQKSSPLPVSVYSWASFDFLGENVLTDYKVDATTYIHETGHLLGLLDYYSDNGNTSYQPTGFMDMMDYNLGDHSPVSKYLLNWTSPQVLDMGDDNQKSITLKSFTDSGDFILIPQGSYNGTPYDRYLLVSFFTPTGLNDMSNYPSYVYNDKEGNQQVFTYPNQYGVLVHEIDARLAYFKSDVIRNVTPTCTVDQTPPAGNYVINFYRDNNVSNANDEPFCHLLESSGLNTFKDGMGASNKTLFKYGATFGIDTFKELANEIGVTFKISKLTLNEAVVTFSKV